MTGKLKRLRKPLLLVAAAIWLGYVFIAKGIGEGVMTVVLLLVMLIAMNVEL